MAIKDFTNLFPGAPNTKTNMPDVVNKTDRVRASHVNKLVDAHLEVETLIGDDSLPAGSLRKRVSDLESAGVGAHASNHTDGTDNIAVATSSTVGLCPILDGSSTKYLNGLGTWSVPPGDGGISTIEAASDTPTGYGSTSGLILESNGVDSFTFKAFTHDLGGSDHSADTLANLNSKISDATLDDSSSSRTPSGSASGQLGGSYPNPDVRGLRETNGPTLLTIGSITDGQYLKRSGSTLIGASTTGGGSGGILNTKGDILTHNGSNEIRLGVGSNNLVLTADDSAINGIKWSGIPTRDLSYTLYMNDDQFDVSSLGMTTIKTFRFSIPADVEPTVAYMHCGIWVNDSGNTATAQFEIVGEGSSSQVTSSSTTEEFKSSIKSISGLSTGIIYTMNVQMSLTGSAGGEPLAYMKFTQLLLTYS